jgi:hypothetical protein
MQFFADLPDVSLVRAVCTLRYHSTVGIHVSCAPTFPVF